jgi:hypothetical protein
MMVAGIAVTDTDSLMAAADILEDVETWITCPECNGARHITDYSPSHGYIDIQCPCCEGNGSILDLGDDFDPEPPSPAAPAVAVVIPLFRCMTCRDTGRTVKPSSWFAGKTIAGFCPDCTPHFDFAAGRFVHCGAADRPGEAIPLPAPVPFDRAAHCQRIGQTGGLTTYERYGAVHYRTIGKAGYAATVATHGQPYATALLSAKGWTAPRRPDLLSDLAAGRILADLDRAA